MEQILGLITQYGIPPFIIAICIIAFVGVLKVCKVFDKLEDKPNLKRFIFWALDMALSFGGVAIYYAIFKKDFGTYVFTSLGQSTVTLAVYQAYKSIGLRKLVQMALTALANFFKNNTTVKKLAKKFGLSDEFVDNLTKELTNLGENATKKEVKQAEKNAVAIIKEAGNQIKQEKKEVEQQKAKEVKTQQKANVEATNAKIASVKAKMIVEQQKQGNTK